MKIKAKTYINKNTKQLTLVLPKKMGKIRYKYIPKELDVFIPKRYLKEVIR